MILSSYVQVRTRRGCVELVNGCRSSTYLARGLAPRWRASRSAFCPEVCCESWDQANYTTPLDMTGNPAPWADPMNTATGEFFGLVVDPGGVVLEDSANARRRGESNYAPAGYSPRLLRITGTLICSTARGLAVAEEWVHDVCAAECDDYVTLRVARHCADGTEPEFAAWQSFSRPAHAHSEDVPGIDPCDEVHYDADGDVLNEHHWPITGPLALEPIPVGYQGLSIPDPGLRDLLMCRLVSIDDPGDEAMPACDGRRVVVTYEALSEGLAWPDDLTEWTPSVVVDESPDTCQSRPYDWESGGPDQLEPCGVCGPPCRCASSPLRPLRTAIAVRSCWAPPLATIRQTVLTPIFSSSQRVALKIDLAGGAQGCENLRVLVWEALAGVADPVTPRGSRAYDRFKPCMTVEIAGVPPGGLLTIDGRRRRAVLNCPGYSERPAERVASGAGGSPLTYPPLTCQRRYWIAVDYDAYNVSSDASWRATYIPIEVG